MCAFALSVGCSVEDETGECVWWASIGDNWGAGQAVLFLVFSFLFYSPGIFILPATKRGNGKKNERMKAQPPKSSIEIC